MASSNIVLKEKGDIITENQQLANIFNTYFISITETSSLKFQSFSEINSFYKNHDSITKIKENNIILKAFFFKEASFNEIKKIIKSIKRKKSVISFCIPFNILIESMDIYLPLLRDIIIDSLKRDIFPDELKFVEVIPFLKKLTPLTKLDTDQLVYFLIFQKFLKEQFRTKLMNISNPSYLSY